MGHDDRVQRLMRCVSLCREIIKSAVNASDEDCVIFTGSGSTGAVHKLVHALRISETQPPVKHYLYQYIHVICLTCSGMDNGIPGMFVFGP